MEEILASIRRIITDDETGQARAPKPAQQAQQDDENLEGEGEADNQIIDDIARVLSAGAPAAPVDEEEEILDLTAELGGLELVEDDVEFDAASSEPEFVMEAPASIPPTPTAQEMAPPQMGMQAPQPPQPQAPAQAPEPQPSASQEAASALERAIAALRAGQVPTSTTPQAEPFRFQAAPQPEAMPAPETMAMPEPQSEPEPVPMAIPMAAPEPQAETHPDEPEPSVEAEPEPSFEAQPDTAPTLELMGEPDAELELTEFEMTVVTETEEVVEFEAEPEFEAETEPFWPSEAPTWEAGEPEPEYEPEPVAAQVNGAGAHGLEGASQTLEDSVKDMLRPMLRQWLDENMPRMVTAALKDELGTDSMDGRRD